MMYGYKEVRTISVNRLRSLCIDRGWYTQGTREEYEHLLFDLALAKENITTDDIVEITEDIIEHSDLNYYDFCEIATAVAQIAFTEIDIADE